MRVLVIGAGFAGLLAAAAASRSGHSVTLVERDDLAAHGASHAVTGGRVGQGASRADDVRPRPGAVQGHHPHVLLRAGLTAIDELLPGIPAELHAAGGVPVNSGDIALLARQGWFPTGVPGHELVSMSRPLMEAVVRDRVLGLPRVRVHRAVRVTGLAPAASARPRWSVSLADGTAEPADLVVDASGRGSRLPAWLAELGVARPETTVVDAGVGYATRRYALPADALHPIAAVILQLWPESPIGGMGLPIEGGHWLIAAQGCAGRRPPRDAVGMEEHLRALPDPVLADLARAGAPAGEVVAHRQTRNVRQHYERLRHWPDGLLAMGDALCAFNPLYGQGISVAALQARLLADALTRSDDVRTRRLLRQMQHVADLPWAVATGVDGRYPGASDSPPGPLQRAMNRWTDELSELGTHGDLRAQAALSRVYQLVGSPTELLSPALVAIALRTRLTRRPPAVPRPPLAVRTG